MELEHTKSVYPNFGESGTRNDFKHLYAFFIVYSSGF